MKKAILTTICIFSATAAFAYIHPTSKMFETWIGTPVKTVVKYWGNPTDITYGRGQTEYEWTEVSSRYIPGTQFQEKTECNRKLIVDVSGKVVYGTFSGNGCPFTSASVKKWNKPDEI